MMSVNSIYFSYCDCVTSSEQHKVLIYIQLNEKHNLTFIHDINCFAKTLNKKKQLWKLHLKRVGI